MLKRWITDRLPDSFQGAGRYWFRRCLGRLDPEMVTLENILRGVQGRALDIGANRGVYSYLNSEML
jgi:hypothetical protein